MLVTQQKEQKGMFILDPMVSTVPPYMDYLTSIGGYGGMSWVGKSVGTLGPIPRGSNASMPLSVGVSQMELEAPPRYLRKCLPYAHMCLTQMEWYMKLMWHVPTDFLDVVAMRMEVGSSS